MKNNAYNAKNTALCGICAALSCVLMLTSYFPYLTYAIPAVSGLFMMIPVIELGIGWAYGTYAASLLPILLLAEGEAKLIYLVLFGYYPILKATLDKLPPVLGWIFKLATVNAAIAAAYAVLAPLTGIEVEDLGEGGKLGMAVLLIAANAAFVLYDIAIARVSVMYQVRIRPKLRKYLG